MKKIIRKIIKEELKSIIKESKLNERFDYDRARDVIESAFNWNNVESEGRDETRFDFKGGGDSMWISSKGKVRGNIPRNPGLRRAIKDLGIKEGKLTEALARGLKPLLQLGSTIKSNVGENALIKLSDKFDKIDDEQAEDVASHLNMAIELMQDRSPAEARGWMSKFNKACKDALSGKSVKSAFEGVNAGNVNESKISLNEKFASKKIQSLFGKVGKYGKDKSFLDGMARQYGIQWDQLTDDMVKGPDTRLDNKGIDIVIASKDVNLAPSSTYDWTTRIGAGQLLAVTVKGKRVWIGNGVKTGSGSSRAFIGLDKRGYANVKDILGIDGATVYHLDPEEAARGAKQKIEDRKTAKLGATALMDARKMKQDNMIRYRKALQIKAGEAGKGAIVKMLEEATKMFEKALQEKLTKMKAGFIPRDSYYADTLKTISSRYQYMVRAFEEYMRAGANIEAIKAKYKDQPDKADSAEYSTKYEDERMSSQAKEVKDEFNKMKMELSKLAKATEYVDVNTLGRSY